MSEDENPQRHLVRSFSQDGEDRLLLRLFKHRRQGFYIDIGAHHPFRFSNTALLHELGWRGLNIEPTPGAMEAFVRHRPGDINLGIAVADREGTIPFKIFSEGAYNTLSLGRSLSASSGITSSIIEVPCARIDTLLRRHLSPGQRVDVVSVDVEGLEMTVLRHYPFEAYPPAAVVVEDHGFDIAEPASSPTFRLLAGKGYHLRCHGLFSSLYVNWPLLERSA